MSLQNLQGLFVEQLKDLYSAETQLTESLPKMASAVTNEELREALEEHISETREHVQRLQEVFSELNESPGGEFCDAMKGLIVEGEKILDKPGNSDVKDAAIIAAAQRVEHYEIAGYGTVVAYANRLGHSKVESLLKKTLDEEGHADKKLTKLAEGTWLSSGINQQAQAR